MVRELNPRCPYCSAPLLRWEPPPESGWQGDFQYVCFNDECAYFIRGARWMLEHYSVTASYRYRLDPLTGESGPLPVWSINALKSGILAGIEEDHA